MKERKYTLFLESDLHSKALTTTKLFLNDTLLPLSYVESRGLVSFGNLEDLKETTLWNLNCSKIKTKFLQSNLDFQTVRCEIFA